MQTLYRAFRPDTFDKVVGQKQVVEILKNQVIQDSVRHAYLFQGTRGTGKTSCAKILSRAVNCLHPQHGNPCNECENCKAIIEESTMDVIEMDAASNRRIDDIRELRERVKYLPSNLKKKVVIIDEAHMITNEAFNALLKTLEEPPGHVIFILATTDMDAIPQTILSRCQIFTFHRISADEMTDHLEFVVGEVNREAERDALEFIAYRADGAMRDALSMLEQVLAVTDATVTLDDVQNATGHAGELELFTLSKAIQKADGKDALKAAQELKDKGREAEQLLDDLIEHFRKLMVSHVTDDRRLFAGSDEIFTQYQEFAHSWHRDMLIACLRELIEIKSQIRFTDDAYTLVIAAILTLCQMVQKKTLEERIEKLEAYVFSGQMAHCAPVEEEKPKSILDEWKQNEPIQAPVVKDEPKQEESKESSEPEKAPVEPKEKIEKQPKGEGKEISSSDWENILENIRNRSMFLHAYLREGKLETVENNMVTIAFPDGYEIHKNAVQKDENRIIIKEELERFYGEVYEVQIVMEKDIKKKTIASVESVIDFLGAENIERE